jgi:hypothetical protein
MDPPPADGLPLKEEIEYSNTNRAIAWGLVGTCIAILTFLLAIYYDASPAGFDPGLFQASLSIIVVSMFLMSFAASYYSRVVRPTRKEYNKALDHVRTADIFFFLGVLFLSAEPALILLTVRLYYAATIAVIFWLVSIGLGYRIRDEFR